MLLSFEILKRNKDTVNKINVFPVSDGDTGNNLCSAVSTLENIEFNDIHDILKLNVNEIMMNGRGCSGNIFSLFLYGLHENYSDNLHDMFKRASEFAWDSMYNPVEGTILTAMRDVPKEYDSFEDFIYRYIQNAYRNLFNGPDLLPILKANNTLDSGTLGFLYILCDVYYCITGKDISPDIDLNEPLYHKNEKIENRYCVEMNLISNNSNIRSLLSDKGSELIFLSSGNDIKLHIHTDDYSYVYDLCKSIGEIKDYKIEDMENNNERIFI